MVHDVADTIFGRHIVIALFAFCGSQAGLPENFRVFYTVVLLPRGTDFFCVLCGSIFMRAAAGLTLYFRDRFAIHCHNRMVKHQLAFCAMGRNILSRGMFFQHTILLAKIRRPPLAAISDFDTNHYTPSLEEKLMKRLLQKYSARALLILPRVE
jgi:hypothetical protein